MSLRKILTTSVVLLLLQMSQARPGTWQYFEGVFKNIAPFANEEFAETFHEGKLVVIKAFFTETLFEARDILKDAVKDIPNLEIKSDQLNVYTAELQNFIKQVDDYSTEKKGDVFLLFEDFMDITDKYVEDSTIDEVKSIAKLLKSHNWNDFLVEVFLKTAEVVIHFYTDIGIYIATLSEADRAKEAKLITWYDEIFSEGKRGQRVKKFPKVFHLIRH